MLLLASNNNEIQLRWYVIVLYFNLYLIVLFILHIFNVEPLFTIELKEQFTQKMKMSLFTLKLFKTCTSFFLMLTKK